MVDLSQYSDQIHSDKDRPLFSDAEASAKVGALRAAYVMIWLSCAESLKQRFREAQKRDGSAGKIVGEILRMETDHKSVDKYVLEEAHKYGFLSDAGHTVLNHVYEMRCIYGHPYEEAPSEEQVAHAAAVAVEHVLSRPVKLRHGFGEQLLKSLIEDKSYLDDQKTAVMSFTKEIVPRIDDSIFDWLLERYWTELEPLVGDSSMNLFVRRGICFSQTLLITIGTEVFSDEEWHNKVSQFPRTLTRVLSHSKIFKHIGKRAQDYVVSEILSEANTRASIIKRLEGLKDAKVLSKRQQKRFTEYIEKINSKDLRSAGLSTITSYDRIISALKSYNWYTQNPAIDLLVTNGPEQAEKLSQEQQMELGRNILQAGQGGAGSANTFLDKLAEDIGSWPIDMVRGIVFETFTNENNEIRFKESHLDKILQALNSIGRAERKSIIGEIITSINNGIPRRWVDQEKFDEIAETTNKYNWAKPLVNCLKEKGAKLPKRKSRR